MLSHLLRYEGRIYIRSKDVLMWGVLFPFAFLTIFGLALRGLISGQGMQIDPIKTAYVRMDDKAGRLAFADMMGGGPAGVEGSIGLKGETVPPSALPAEGLSDLPTWSAEIKTATAPEALEQLLTRGGEITLEDFLLSVGATRGEWQGDRLVSEKIEAGEETEQDKENFLTLVQAKDAAEGEQWLKEKKVNALIYIDDPIYFKTRGDSSFDAMIVRQMIEGFTHFSDICKSIAEGYIRGDFPMPDAATFTKSATDDLKANLFQGINKSNRNRSIDGNMSFFFAVLAYVIFFPISAGVEAVAHVEADQTGGGLLGAVSPVSKGKRFFASFLPKILFQIVLGLLFYGYTQILGIDYGGRHGYIILMIIIGTLAAVLTGTALGSILPVSAGVKTGLGVALPLAFGFCAGMMSKEVQTLLIEKAPALLAINPIAMMSNSLYALNGDGDLSRYFYQIAGLGIYTAVCAVLTIVGMRRLRYESL